MTLIKLFFDFGDFFFVHFNKPFLNDLILYSIYDIFKKFIDKIFFCYKIIYDINCDRYSDKCKSMYGGRNMQAINPFSPNVLDRLELDIETGMMYCAESEDVYLDVLDEYRNDDKRAELKEFFDAQNWERYRISAHSVKSSSLTIGATDLYEIARQIEEPLKDMDFGPALRLHDDLMKAYSEVLDMLNRELDK